MCLFLPSRYRLSSSMSKNLELLKDLPWTMSKGPGTSTVFPQHGEVIWNKTHRYSRKQLDDIYIALKGLLGVVKILQRLCKKCAEREEDRGSGKSKCVVKAEKCLMRTKDPHSDHTSKIIFPTAKCLRLAFYYFTHRYALTTALVFQLPPLSLCYRPRNLSAPAPELWGPQKRHNRGVSAHNPLSPSPPPTNSIYLLALFFIPPPLQKSPTHLPTFPRSSYFFYLSSLFPSGWTS